MSDTIMLNGIAWDVENLEVNGKTHFTYMEALNIAKAFGKRLPTNKDFEKLLELPHEWDATKKGMWFAEKEEDLKGEKSLFLMAAGIRYNCDTTITETGRFGCYWSDTPDGIYNAYDLYFGSANAFMYSSSRKNSFTVRCVSDMNKSEVMKTNQEIEFKIPEGYVIDNRKSTENKIVCKPIVIKYPKSWEDAFVGNPICGYWIGAQSDIIVADRCAVTADKNVFKTKKQAASALAYAQLTQLMALPCYNGDWVPNWDDPNQTRCCIARLKNDIIKSDFSGYFSFLAFKSEKVRDAFFDNHIDLIKQFYQS